MSCWKTCGKLELFDKMENIRPKDFIDYFRELDEEKQNDLLHDIAYGIQGVSWALSDCIFIAQGVEE